MAVAANSNLIKTGDNNRKKRKKNAHSDKKIVLVAQELKIARVLAGNEKSTRDKALKSLRKWFQQRSQTLPFTDEDFLRIWKGLFYSMWMSDKPLIQEECAENISNLVHSFPLEPSLSFFKCGLITLCREWFGIDQLRLEKFLMFVRRFLRQGLIVLKNHAFKSEVVNSFNEILLETVLEENGKPLGLFLHFTDIYLEELAKVSEGKIKPHLVTLFVKPFARCLATSSDKRRMKNVVDNVFRNLMKQSDLGIEYEEKYEAWKQEGFPGSIHLMKKVDEPEDVSDEETDSALDPRAGRVDVVLPRIRFNPRDIANVLNEFKFHEDSNRDSRTYVSLLIKQFHKLANGIYPLGITKLLGKEEKNKLSVKKATNRLFKLDKKLLGDNKKRKRKQNDVSAKKIKLDTEDDDLEKLLRRDEKIIKKKRSTKRLKKPIEPPNQVFKRNSGTWLVYNLNDTPSEPISENIPEEKEPQKDLFPKNEWDEPLKEGEYEISIPARKHIEKIKSIAKKTGADTNSLLRKSMAKNRLSLDSYVSVPERTKKVKINVKLNQSQEIDEHEARVMSSPGIPFDANKKPSKPLLKKRLSLPPNPFYKRISDKW